MAMVEAVEDVSEVAEEEVGEKEVADVEVNAGGGGTTQSKS